jgi:hypothetical protein
MSGLTILKHVRNVSSEILTKYLWKKLKTLSHYTDLDVDGR